MKKTFLLIATIALLGAGCSQESVPQNPQTEADIQAESASSTSSDTPSETPEIVSGDLKKMPAPDTSKAPQMDVSTWSTTELKIGVKLTAPTKGANAPTWTYSLLANDDSHLKGNCYVTEATVGQRTDVAGRADSCLTTTALDAGPGTRTDYFVFRKETPDAAGKQVSRTHLFTFTKVYPAGFDMDAYAATLDQIIGLIE
jgi:hypothetical protein